MDNRCPYNFNDTKFLPKQSIDTIERILSD